VPDEKQKGWNMGNAWDDNRRREEATALDTAYTNLSRSDMPLAVRKDALLTILVLDWAPEILARGVEFQKRRDAARAEIEQRDKAIRARTEQVERERAESEALRAAEHERLMREDANYAFHWNREHPRR
jgi:hypothetical protein